MAPQQHHLGTPPGLRCWGYFILQHRHQNMPATRVTRLQGGDDQLQLPLLVTRAPVTPAACGQIRKVSFQLPPPLVAASLVHNACYLILHFVPVPHLPRNVCYLQADATTSTSCSGGGGGQYEECQRCHEEKRC